MWWPCAFFWVFNHILFRSELKLVAITDLINLMFKYIFSKKSFKCVKKEKNDEQLFTISWQFMNWTIHQGGQQNNQKSHQYLKLSQQACSSSLVHTMKGCAGLSWSDSCIMKYIEPSECSTSRMIFCCSRVSWAFLIHMILDSPAPSWRDCPSNRRARQGISCTD